MNAWVAWARVKLDPVPDWPIPFLWNSEPSNSLQLHKDHADPQACAAAPGKISFYMSLVLAGRKRWKTKSITILRRKTPWLKKLTCTTNWFFHFEIPHKDNLLYPVSSQSSSSFFQIEWAGLPFPASLSSWKQQRFSLDNGEFSSSCSLPFLSSSWKWWFGSFSSASE